MTEYITGAVGIGKTKLMAVSAVETSKISKGNVIYVDSTDNLMHVLPSNIRLIECPEIIGKSSTAFIGFLLGLCKSNYDLTDVFVDSSVKYLSDSTDSDDFFLIVDELSKNTNVNFHFAITNENEKQLEYMNV